MNCKIESTEEISNSDLKVQHFCFYKIALVNLSVRERENNFSNSSVYFVTGTKVFSDIMITMLLKCMSMIIS